MPLSQETYGRLGSKAMEILNHLGKMTVAGGRSARAAFLKTATAELSVALQRKNEDIFRMFGFNFAKLSGRDFVPGDAMPSALLG